MIKRVPIIKLLTCFDYLSYIFSKLSNIYHLNETKLGLGSIKFFKLYTQDMQSHYKLYQNLMFSRNSSSMPVMAISDKTFNYIFNWNGYACYIIFSSSFTIWVSAAVIQLFLHRHMNYRVGLELNLEEQCINACILHVYLLILSPLICHYFS